MAPLVLAFQSRVFVSNWASFNAKCGLLLYIMPPKGKFGGGLAHMYQDVLGSMRSCAIWFALRDLLHEWCFVWLPVLPYLELNAVVFKLLIMLGWEDS